MSCEIIPTPFFMKKVKKLKKKYINIADDLKKLNIEIPDIMPKATEEIAGMVELIKILLKKL